MPNFIDSLAAFLNLSDQDATVDNFGFSTANTGHNDVTGNNSFNVADSSQRSSAGGFFGPGDDATAVNQASNLNISNGTAALVTGSASAVGNVADTQIAELGGGLLGDQDASVMNFGVADANTGHNTVIGNNSTNVATSFQDADAGGFFGPGDDATAVNSVENMNVSDGTAVLETGNASAVGNVADTDIFQSDGGYGFGLGFGFGDQDANVYNYGDASADTGHNTVIGNNSTNVATSYQDADAGGFFGPGDDATAVNSATNSNYSDGTAVLHTGDASAVGNVADTDIHQGSDGYGLGFGDQDANVYNYGDASADTGHNTVIGNNSTNVATSYQDADAGGMFGPGDDATAVNSAHNSNVSNGTAVVETGDAHAVGNVADTDIHQDADHFDIHDIF